MWILESQGDFFQGKRMWLKPGKQYLFGRVKRDGVAFVLNHKTVSRKHFVISVEDVGEAEVGNVHARTRITITDQNSKTGTAVNGDLAKDSSRDLIKSENSIKIGGCEQQIIVRWKPCVLTFNLLKKEIKAGVLKTKQERVREFGIKAISEYIPGTTTHLVAPKRNTAKGLQALIDGRWVVTESFLNDLEYAATPADLNEEENLSPLEEDFDRAWPDASRHLPAPSKELTVRSVDLYRPSEDRRNIFENFIFVFADQVQYDNLLPAITTGHGKALMFKAQPHQTTLNDLVAFLRGAAGTKGFGDVQKESDKGAVILVRWTDKAEEQWANDLMNQVALELDQRVIDQGEFLDAILINDAFSLRQAVPFESNPEGHAAPSSTAISMVPLGQTSQNGSNGSFSSMQGLAAQAVPHSGEANDSGAGHATNGDHSQDTSHQGQASNDVEESAVPMKRARFIPPSKDRYKSIDDLDSHDIISVDSEDDDDNNVSPGNVVSRTRKEASIASPQAGSDVLSDGDGVQQGSPNTKKRQRPIGREPTNVPEDRDDDYDDIVPAAAAMKRRKLAVQGDSIQGKPVQRPKFGGSVILPSLRQGTKDIDIKEELRSKRAAEQETARKRMEEENIAIELDDSGQLPVYEIRVEDVDLPVRKKISFDTGDIESERWEAKWNGRKNFKAFRRARTGANGANVDRDRRTHTRVIVPLVDAKAPTHGIGEQYWDRSEEDRQRERERKKRASQRTTQSQNAISMEAVRTGHNQDIEHETPHGSDSETTHSVRMEEEDSVETTPRISRLQQEAAAVLDHEVDIDEPRTTRAGDRTTQTKSSTQTETPPSSGKTIRGAKRPANTIGGRANATKRQKTLPVSIVHGSDSESDGSNDGKFKFGGGRPVRKKT